MVITLDNKDFPSVMDYTQPFLDFEEKRSSAKTTKISLENIKWFIQNIPQKKKKPLIKNKLFAFITVFNLFF